MVAADFYTLGYLNHGGFVTLITSATPVTSCIQAVCQRMDQRSNSAPDCSSIGAMISGSLYFGELTSGSPAMLSFGPPGKGPISLFRPHPITKNHEALPVGLPASGYGSPALTHSSRILRRIYYNM